MFKHDFKEIVDLEQITMETGRVYKHPDGTIFPSVTTVLDRSPHFDKTFLERWKKRVGLENAKKIVIQAQNRGTGFHSILEKFLLNDPNFKKGAMPLDIENYLKVKETLLLNVSTIFGLEIPLHSRLLNTAGKTDLFCQWNGTNAIADFKTSKKPKTAEDIRHYFVQGTCYAMMAEEMYDMHIPKVVVIMINDESRYPQIFNVETNEYRDLTKQIYKDNTCLKQLSLPPSLSLSA